MNLPSWAAKRHTPLASQHCCGDCQDAKADCKRVVRYGRRRRLDLGSIQPCCKSRFNRSMSTLLGPTARFCVLAEWVQAEAGLVCPRVRFACVGRSCVRHSGPRARAPTRPHGVTFAVGCVSHRTQGGRVCLSRPSAVCATPFSIPHRVPSELLKRIDTPILITVVRRPYPSPTTTTAAASAAAVVGSSNLTFPAAGPLPKRTPTFP